MDSVFVNSHPDHGLMGCYRAITSFFGAPLFLFILAKGYSRR
jgi:hypothetical protein